MHSASVASSSRWPADRVEKPILPIEVRGLRFESRGVSIINDLDVTIEAGGSTVIMGYNGAGKSVLLRLLHGLLKPTGGRLSWAHELGDKELRRRQAMVFQHPVLLRRSVADNIRYAMKLAGLSHEARESRLQALLTESDLLRVAKRASRVLSGGERQRVAIVRALSVDPEILFLDEPTASLDPASTQTIEKLILQARGRGTKIVMVTQSIGQAKRFAQDVVFIHHGRVTEHTPADQFFDSPASAAARAFTEGRLEP